MTTLQSARRKITLSYSPVFCVLITVVFASVPIRFSCAANSSSVAQRYPSIYGDTALKRVVLLGIDHTIRERFDTADSIFSELADRYPKSPVGPLFRAAVLQTKMLDHEDGRPVRQLKTLIRETIDKAERWRKRAPEDPEPIFYQAGAHGYRAVYESHWGGWFAALKQGLKAANRFKEIIELDPTFFDAYVGLGNYLYWKSAKTGFIRWLPFIPDNRQKGIKYLRRAVDKGVFSTQTARTSLMWVLLDYGFPEEALGIAEKLHEEYPEAKAFLWGIGLSSLAAYRWGECIEAFDSLQARIAAEGPGNYFNLIECAYYKAEASYKAGDYTRCREECRRAFSYPAPAETKKRLKNRLSKLEKRYRELGKYAQKEG